MPLCQVCGVNMGASEVTQRRDGQAGNWHYDCAYIDYLADVGEPAATDGWVKTILCERQHVIDKHNGTATDFP